MSKGYLLIGPTKKNFKTGTKIVYFNKLSQQLSVNEKQNRVCKVSNLDISNKGSYFQKKELNFVKKKVSKYLSELTINLNNIHQSKFKKEYWGLLLENYLFSITFDIFLNKRIFEKHKNRFKSFKFINEKIFIKKSGSLNFFLTSIINDLNFSKFVKSKIITLHLNKSKKKFKYIYSNKEIKNKKNYLLIFIKRFIIFYIKLLKPAIILNPYFGSKNSLKLIVKSFGKILILSRNFLLPSFQNSFKKNNFNREKLSVKENDNFDKIFNQVNKEYFPASYLENYKIYSNEVIALNHSIKLLGSGILLYTDDFFKILAAQIKYQNGKIINFQHGGCDGKFIFDIHDHLEKKYCYKKYLWHQDDYIGNTYLPKLKQLKEKKSNGEKILILPTEKKNHDNFTTVVNRAYNDKYNPRHNLNFHFFNSLDKELKEKTIVKIFPSKNEEKIKKIWKSNTSKKIKMYSSNLFFQYDWFKEIKIAIMDDVSTPLYETLYLNIPTVIVCNDLREFTKKFKSSIVKLRKLNLFFSKADEAAKFINKNYSEVDIWWSNVLKSTDFRKFKKQLFKDKGFNPNNHLIRDILKLRS